MASLLVLTLWSTFLFLILWAIVAVIDGRSKRRMEYLMSLPEDEFDKELNAAYERAVAKENKRAKRKGGSL